MAKKYKPTSAARRQMMGYDFSDLTRVKPLRAKTRGWQRSQGRNSGGLITVRHRGGGVKRKYRLIDFKQQKFNVPGWVFALEYDPNRSARIARIHYADGDKRYVLAPEGLKAGDQIVVKERTALKPGNRLPLKFIPQGTEVYNLEFQPGQGGKVVRAAGSRAVVMSKDAGYVQVQMPSSELRKFAENCLASVGRLSNAEHNFIVLGKAGRSRQLGRRPAVRGTAMNPVDHPHGGGEGRQGIGLPHPKTPWGKPALGVKTRKKKKRTSHFIIRRRQN